MTKLNRTALLALTLAAGVAFIALPAQANEDSYSSQAEAAAETAAEQASQMTPSAGSYTETNQGAGDYNPEMESFSQPIAPQYRGNHGGTSVNE